MLPEMGQAAFKGERKSNPVQKWQDIDAGFICGEKFSDISYILKHPTPPPTTTWVRHGVRADQG